MKERTEMGHREEMEGFEGMEHFDMEEFNSPIKKPLQKSNVLPADRMDGQTADTKKYDGASSPWKPKGR